MAGFTPIARKLGIGLGSLALVGSILLVATHQKPSCDLKIAGGEWQHCDTNFCPGPAMNIEAAITSTEYDVSCPWRTTTYTFSYLAIGLSLIFIAVYAFAPRFKQIKLGTFIIVAGLISFALLLTSFVMMIVDIIDGDNSRPSFFINNYSVHQTPFVLNSVIHSVGLVAIASLTIITFRESKKAVLLTEGPETVAHGYYLSHYSRVHRYIGIGGASIALIASFMLLLTHDQNKCSFTVNGSSRSKCQEDLMPFICPSPAVDIKITSNSGIQYDIICAWGTGTLAVSIASFLLSLVFLLLHSFKIRKMKATKFVLGTGVLALASLAVSFVMMFVDIIRGNDTIASDYSKFQGDKDFRQWAFVINLLLVVASFVAILSLEMHNYKEHYQRNKKEFLSPEDHEIEEFYFG